MARKPAKLRLIEGNRSRRPIPNELQVHGVPELPKHLTPAQIERWHEVVRSLPDDYLSRADTQALERMAIAWAQFREATAQINSSALLTRGANGEPVRNPLLIVQSKAAQEMHEAGALLGLSPLARTKLLQPESPDEGPLDKLFSTWGA